METGVILVTDYDTAIVSLDPDLVNEFKTYFDTSVALNGGLYYRCTDIVGFKDFLDDNSIFGYGLTFGTYIYSPLGYSFFPK